MSTSLVHCRRPAMATLFAIWLVGDDEEHLAAIGEAALDEIERVEKVLSRFDPAAELARVNRLAATRAVLVSPELFAVLCDCGERHIRTQGYFDVCAGSPAGLPFPEAVSLNEADRTITFTTPGVALDLGGYGKGYALDAAARLLDSFAVPQALLHGGTSSVLARGTRGKDQPWIVGLRDPSANDDAPEIARVSLVDAALSSSATRTAGTSLSDILDPTSGRPLSGQAACAVVAATATAAEVLSTALLAMGKKRARVYRGRNPRIDAGPYSVCWIEPGAGDSSVEWFRETRHDED